MKYEIILTWSQTDSTYIAEVPELPGCMADGATYEEALANTKQCIEEWIATAREVGRPIPEPVFADEVQLQQWHLDLIDERLALAEKNPEKRIPWEEVKKQLERGR